MDRRDSDKTRDLLSRLAVLRRSPYFPSAMILGLILLGAGIVMFVLAVHGNGDTNEISRSNLMIGLFGVASFASGVLLFICAALQQLSHDILLRVDEEYKQAQERKRVPQ